MGLEILVKTVPGCRFLLYDSTEIFAGKLRCGEMVASEEVVQECDVGWLPGVA
jgi:hypothetical protein